jgi:large subunit ribosomal protein L31
MKQSIHPVYREVVYLDVSSGYQFLTRSTVQTRETIAFDGQEYPLHRVEISSASHPFYTGKERLLDTEGRVERFNRKYAKTSA